MHKAGFIFDRGRYLLQLSTAHHSFQMKMKTTHNIAQMFEQGQNRIYTIDKYKINTNPWVSAL